MRIRNAVVVGATQGVGRSVALRLNSNGVKVAAIGRDTSLLAELQSEFESDRSASFAIQSDVTSSDEVSSAVNTIVAAFGSIDAVVYCAGIGVFGAVNDFTNDDWNRTIATNLTGLFYWTRETSSHLSENSHLIAISSGAAKQGIAELSAYCASKYGLMGFMESMAAELSPKVRVATVVPGSILTNWGEPIEDKRVKLENGEASYLTADDVTQAVVFLLDQSETARTQEMNVWPA